MRIESLKLELFSALLGTGLVQPIDSGTDKSAKKYTIWFLCRQVPGAESRWLDVMDKLLQANDDIHICRRYVRRNDKLAFGWYLSLTSMAPAIVSDVGVLKQVLSSAKPALTHEPAQQPVVARMPDASSSVTEEELTEAMRKGGRVPVGEPARVRSPPVGFNPNPREVLRTIDPETGSLRVETEIPLPHIYSEMNKPNAKGRGAKKLGAG